MATKQLSSRQYKYPIFYELFISSLRTFYFFACAMVVDVGHARGVTVSVSSAATSGASTIFLISDIVILVIAYG